MAQAFAKKCNICTDEYGVFYCYECQHALCTVCRERHDKIPAVSGHSITDINIIDLSNVKSDKFMCITHEKEYQFYCVKCSDVICRKCVTSTHKDHSFSEISEVVSENRAAAQSALKTLQSKIDVISSVKDTVRGKHLDKLHCESQLVINDIIVSIEELLTFLHSKEDIKKTEVEDNERIEQQSIELFLQNTDLLYDQYVQVFTELQNVVYEKYDITFYKLYRAVDKDITCLDDIPKEPTLPCVLSLDKTMLYTELFEYIQSKTETRLCKKCISQEDKLVQILTDNNQLKSDVNDKAVEIKRLQLSIKDMKTENAKIQEDNAKLSKRIKSLKERF